MAADRGWSAQPAVALGLFCTASVLQVVPAAPHSALTHFGSSPGALHAGVVMRLRVKLTTSHSGFGFDCVAAGVQLDSVLICAGDFGEKLGLR